MAAKPVEVMTTAVDGTYNMLELARKRHCKSFVYLSSMEVYGNTELGEVCETDLGSLDLLSPRTCYPESKRFCEMLCTAYASQYGVPVKTARLSQTFGAGTPKDDTRVFAQFARSAIAGEDIILHTEGKSRGNYCYLSDTIRALMLILLTGENKQTYNVSNPDASMTVREMAELVAGEVCKGRVRVKVEIPPGAEKLGYAPYSGYKLNADRIKRLKWQPKYGLKDMYERLIADWQSNN
jgi:nucleoside-diphosphate-sugar epimerase